MVLVDSSVYIRLLRRRTDPARALTKAFDTLDLVICGMVRVEVLRGVKAEKVKARLAAFMDVMINVPTDNRLWEETQELAWALDRGGLTLPAQDLLIACCARRVGADVLTLDGHFSHIPKLRLAEIPADWR